MNWELKLYTINLVKVQHNHFQETFLNVQAAKVKISGGMK